MVRTLWQAENVVSVTSLSLSICPTVQSGDLTIVVVVAGGFRVTFCFVATFSSNLVRFVVQFNRGII
jgi:hypothetical protein